MPTASLIANKRAGTAMITGTSRSDLMRRLAARGVTVLRKPRGRIARQLEQAALDRPDMIVAAGGDGTISAAAATAREIGVPLGIVPLGTMNLLARDYDIPLDVDAALDVIARGHARPVAAASLDGHLFLHSAFIGMPVRIGTHREARRGALGILERLRLVVHALRSLRRDPLFGVRPVEAGERVAPEPLPPEASATGLPAGAAAPGAAAVLEREAAAPEAATTKTGADRSRMKALSASGTVRGRSLVILVGEAAEPLLPFPRRAGVGGEILTVYAIRPPDILAALRVVLRGVIGTLDRDRDVTVLRTRAAHILTPRKRMHVMLDGETRFLSPRARLLALPGAIRVLVP